MKAGLTQVEAQEVVQETVIAVAKNIANFKRDSQRGSFKAWLMHQTRWRIADQFRKRQVGPAGLKRAGARGTDETDDRTATVDRIPDPAGSELEAVWDSEWAKHLLSTGSGDCSSRKSRGAKTGCVDGVGLDETLGAVVQTGARECA